MSVLHEVWTLLARRDRERRGQAVFRMVRLAFRWGRP
jgi:hypothetical protein